MVLTKRKFGPKPLTKQASPDQRYRAIQELIFAGALWGFGFVAARWALTDFTAPETLLLRFFIAFFIGEVVRSLFFKGPKNSSDERMNLWLPLGGGFFLGGMLLLQTIGLQYTTATKSGFITTLYVLLVPLIQHLFFRIKISPWLYVYITGGLAGTWLLIGGQLSEFNQGDLWTLACSFLGAGHILFIGWASPQIKDSFKFNNFQSLSCLLLILPFYLLQKDSPPEEIFARAPSTLALIGILFLGIGSNLIAFLIQVRAQKILPPVIASMLFLLESPFAFLFGWLLLNEQLSAAGALGAGLIMVSAILTVLHENRQKEPIQEFQ